MGKTKKGGYVKSNDLRVPTPAVRMPEIDPINPPQPNLTYQSQIDTSAPLKPYLLESLTASAKMPYSAPGGGATGASRSAFANALLSDLRRTTLTDADRFNVAQMTQAEKSRAEDILSQRQSAHDRFRMDEARDIFAKDTDMRYRSGMQDLKEQYAREKKEAEAQIIASIF